MSKRKLSRPYVVEAFAKKIKKEAIDEGLTLIDYTERLANDGKPLKKKWYKNDWSF